MSIKIILNGEERKFEKNLTISELIQTFEIDLTKVAIEKNLEIINFEDFEKITIADGDKIEMVHFIGGG